MIQETGHDTHQAAQALLVEAKQVQLDELDKHEELSAMQALADVAHQIYQDSLYAFGIPHDDDYTQISLFWNIKAYIELRDTYEELRYIDGEDGFDPESLERFWNQSYRVYSPAISEIVRDIASVHAKRDRIVDTFFGYKHIFSFHFCNAFRKSHERASMLTENPSSCEYELKDVFIMRFLDAFKTMFMLDTELRTQYQAEALAVTDLAREIFADFEPAVVSDHENEFWRLSLLEAAKYYKR